MSKHASPTAMSVLVSALFSKSTSRRLNYSGVKTVGQIIEASYLDIMRAAGRKAAKEVAEVMAETGWTWQKIGEGPMQRIEPKRKPGRPVGTLRGGASERVQIRLTPADKQTLAKIAKGHGKTMSGQVVHWIGLARDD